MIWWHTQQAFTATNLDAGENVQSPEAYEEKDNLVVAWLPLHFFIT